MSEKELYCTARMLLGAIFGGTHNVFDGCQGCKLITECMPDGKPNGEMISDRARARLQALTGVPIGLICDTPDRFAEADITNA